MEMLTCARCAHYAKPYDGESFGGCRAHAPIIIYASQLEKVISGWPSVAPEQWCSEFRHNPTPALVRKEDEECDS